MPWLIFGLLGGVAADRLDRRRVMAVVDSGRCVAVGVLAIAVWHGNVTVGLIWLVAFVLGSGEVFFDNSAQSILPNLVETEQIERANARFFVTESVARDLAGPAVGAALFARAASLPFALDSASFLAASLIVSPSRAPRAARPAPNGHDDSSAGAARRSGPTSARAGRGCRSHVQPSWRSALIVGPLLRCCRCACFGRGRSAQGAREREEDERRGEERRRVERERQRGRVREQGRADCRTGQVAATDSVTKNRALARSICSVSTRFGRIDCAELSKNTSPDPSRNATSQMRPTLTLPCHTASGSSPTATQRPASTTAITRRRSRRSAATPPSRPNISHGSPERPRARR